MDAIKELVDLLLIQQTNFCNAHWQENERNKAIALDLRKEAEKKITDAFARLTEENEALKTQHAKDLTEWDQLVFERNSWAAQAERLTEENAKLVQERDMYHYNLDATADKAIYDIGKLTEENQKLREALDDMLQMFDDETWNRHMQRRIDKAVALVKGEQG